MSSDSEYYTGDEEHTSKVTFVLDDKPLAKPVLISEPKIQPLAEPLAEPLAALANLLDPSGQQTRSLQASVDSLAKPLEDLSNLLDPSGEKIRSVQVEIEALAKPLENLANLVEPALENVRSVQASVDSLIQKTSSCLPQRIPVLSKNPPSVNTSLWSCFPWVLKETLPIVQSHIQDQKVSDKGSDPGSLCQRVPPTQASS